MYETKSIELGMEIDSAARYLLLAPAVLLVLAQLVELTTQT
jgi:hypothetical protein